MFPKIVICVVLTFYTFFIIATGQDDDVYPTYYSNVVPFATKLHCKVNENRFFRFEETTQFGVKSADSIKTKAHVIVKCLGADEGGKYGSEGLKYLAMVDEIEMVGKDSNNQKTGKPTSETVTTVQEGLKQDQDNINSKEWKELYTVPYQFVQLADGSIPEIRFGEKEVNNTAIRNFKRHLVDAFATYVVLESKQNATTLETSVVGEHTSSYNISVNGKPVSQNMAAYINSDATLMVEKHVTKDNIRKLPPTKAVNNLENMNLLIQQKQLFKNGNMISSSGTSFLDPFIVQNSEKGTYSNKDADESNSFRFPVSSSFDMQLSGKESTGGIPYFNQYENMKFISTSRFGEENDESYWQQLRDLYESAGDINNMVKTLVGLKAINYKKDMTKLSKIVTREIFLKADREPKSVSTVIRKMFDKQAFETVCPKKNTVCEDFAHLLANAGGTEAEKVFLSLLNEKTSLTLDQQRMIADTLRYFPRSSVQFVASLIKLRSKNGSDKHIKSSVGLAIGFLGSKAQEKDIIAEYFTTTLARHKNDCKTEDFLFLLDTLQAVGNLGSEKTVSSVLEVSETCEENTAIQIACVHAVRHQINLSPVEQWMQKKITKYDNCFVIEGIVGELLQTVQHQKIYGDTVNWPRNGFNKIDESLEKILNDSPCSKKNILMYFGRKKNQIANDIFKHYYKRVQPNKSGYDLDEIPLPKNTIFDKQKQFGTKFLNIEAAVGLFAEYNESLSFEFLANFHCNLNSFGTHKNIATLYVFIKGFHIKAYVRVFGYTFYDRTFDTCSIIELKKKETMIIPVASISLGIFTFSLGIELVGYIGLHQECPESHVFRFGPEIGFRIGGEASAIILTVRIGVSLGGDVSYRENYNMKPFPKMCTSAERGFDPVTISIKGSMQFWNIFRWKWGEKYEWNPGFLSFALTGSNMIPIFPEKCYEY